MLSLFDYVFYRAYKLGEGRASAPLAYASMIVSVAQSLVLISTFSVVDFLVNASHPKVSIYITVIVLFYILNYFRYERNPWVDKMKKMWEHEDQNKKLIRGWLIVFCIALLVATPLTFAKMGFEYKHSVHENIR